MTHVSYSAQKTQLLKDWARVAANAVQDDFLAAREIVTRLGAWPDGEGAVTFGFWLPEALDLGLHSKDVWLELFLPPADFELTAFDGQETFAYQRLPVVLSGGYAWSVAEGVPIGRRERVGAFYQLAYTVGGERRVVRDHLAHSLPFGVFSPAEVYDLRALWKGRKDTEHFKELATEPDADLIERVKAPSNILQLHVPSATVEGTLAALSGVFKGIKAKLESGAALSIYEESFQGYDALQLLPIEPTIEYENAAPFFEPTVGPSADGELTVRLRRPDMINWGYDIVISGAAAVNPVLLGTARPDEFLELIETLHTLPNPMMLILDVVFGHADAQAADVLNAPFVAGPGMYGLSINFREPTVRALMLELQRRKSLYGVDGIRVDGAQDFKYWDAEAQMLRYDDDYLKLMNDIVLDVSGVRYRPYMIFEDGRPWPRDDWELASSYREVSEQLDNVYQWGPLTFAHNTPFLFTFWLSKWWRIREVADLGSHWITGCANHDTLRRGSQVSLDARINTFLGDTLPDILRKAYDNPAAKLYDYVMMPGVPMDFLNASLRAPWSFVRTTDERYSVKVMSEEANFLYWAVDEVSFSANFSRLKAAGFERLERLRSFLMQLERSLQASDYDLSKTLSVLKALQDFDDLDLSETGLKTLARAWMEDLHDYSKVHRHLHRLELRHSRFASSVRLFRLQRPWLRNNLGANEVFEYKHPSQGSVVFYALRVSPSLDEQILCVANMEGESCEVTPQRLIPQLSADGWELSFATPNTSFATPNTATGTLITEPLLLADSQGVVFTRKL